MAVANQTRLETRSVSEAAPLGRRRALTFPETPEQLDLNLGFVTDLALKTLSTDMHGTTASVSESMKLGLVITDTTLQRLYRENLIELKGSIALHNHRYGMLERGWARVSQLMSVCNYVGPAPVTLESYKRLIVDQMHSRAPVTRAVLDQTLSHLVLPDSVKRTLGVVLSSGRSLFLSGPPGNGKTAIARALVDAITEPMWIPYAIEVDGQVIRVFDKHVHRREAHTEDDFDPRWVKIRPPLLVVGGELTIESLDLVTTETPRFYEAPFQLKANGGVLLVDDFGRQRCSARQLLNRWIIPLENRVDSLTLSTGKKIDIPFEQIIVFATNLTDADLTDEAFMRRMGYRLSVSRPTWQTYTEIFRRTAADYGLTVDDRSIERLVKRYKAEDRAPNACEPRDLIVRAADLCHFAHQELTLTDEILGMAWEGYFGTLGEQRGKRIFR
ncbi:MAG TPA: ATP-binding protein [Verrucomicrobiae bacterium]|nr:ATP-binding protein [Verrucomicrobiae bacterium]